MIVFIDMDGVLAWFEKNLKKVVWDPPEMFKKGFFRHLEVMPGAKEFIKWALKQKHLDLYIASKPLTRGEVYWSATEKMEWIRENFPPLVEKMLLVCDKGLLKGDVLIDDDKEQWGDKFKGYFFHFDKNNPKESFKKLKKTLTLTKSM